MIDPLARSLAAFERCKDTQAKWASVPAAQWPDATLFGLILCDAGRSSGHCPNDLELPAVIATAAATASMEAP